MKRLRNFLDDYKFYIYFSLIVAINSLWFLNFLSIWFITFAVILTTPLLSIGLLPSIIFILEDGIFKILAFYFEPSLLSYYPIYLFCVIAVLSLLNFIALRIKKERYKYISALHNLKNESADLKSSLPQTLSQITQDEKKGLGIGSLIQSREDSYKNILTIIKQSFHPYSIFLYLYNPSDDLFYARESVSESEYTNSDSVKSKEGILHAVAKERRTLNIRNLQNSQYTIPYYSKKEDIHSFLAIPLLSGRRLRGILCLDSLESDRFSVREEEIIKGLCKEIIKVIDSSEAMIGLSKIKDELKRVCELGTLLNKNLSELETIEILMDVSTKFVDFSFSCFVSWDPENNRNKIVRIHSDSEEESYEGRDFACDDKLGISSWVIKNSVPLEYSQIQAKRKEVILFNRNFRIPFKFNSLLILPVKSLGRALGAFILASHRDHICREDDKKMLEGICSQIGIALENARMFETLKHLATVDGLTGLNNHRVFQESLSYEIERSERYLDKVSLLLVDIDFFKKFNDRYGHPVGDFVLKEISKILQSMVRKIDLAARYGGEEFAIILVNTDHEGALKMAERIRQRILSTDFKNDDLSLKVSISLGIATYPTSAKSKQELIESADKALYRAKFNGRNQAVHFNDIVSRTDQHESLEFSNIFPPS